MRSAPRRPARWGVAESPGRGWCYHHSRSACSHHRGEPPGFVPSSHAQPPDAAARLAVALRDRFRGGDARRLHPGRAVGDRGDRPGRVVGDRPPQPGRAGDGRDRRRDGRGPRVLLPRAQGRQPHRPGQAGNGETEGGARASEIRWRRDPGRAISAVRADRHRHDRRIRAPGARAVPAVLRAGECRLGRVRNRSGSSRRRDLHALTFARRGFRLGCRAGAGRAVPGLPPRRQSRETWRPPR